MHQPTRSSATLEMRLETASWLLSSTDGARYLGLKLLRTHEAHAPASEPISRKHADLWREAVHALKPWYTGRHMLAGQPLLGSTPRLVTGASLIRLDASRRAD